MQMQEYVQLDALGLAALIRSGQVAPQEVLETAIRRIESLNPAYNAVVEQCFDRAREDILQLDRDAVFAGVPYLIKDLHTPVAGTHLTHGCRFFKDNLSTRDSDLVQRLRRAGFIIVGRTNSPEFGLNTTTEPALFGPTLNPWHKALSAGGSSGGSAAAVASGMVPAAHGTDSGGSIRIPASCCGLVGLKPSRGRILAGLEAGEGWHDLLSAHALTRSVRDSAAILLATCNTRDPAPYRCAVDLPGDLEKILDPPAALTIGVLAVPPSRVAVDGACLQALSEAEKRCADMGHSPVPVQIDFDLNAYARAFTLIVCAKVAAAVNAHEMQTGRKAAAGDFENAIWRCVEIGRRSSAADLSRATAQLHILAQDIVRQLSHVDVLMSPTLAQAPIPLGRLATDGDDISAFMAAVFGFAPFTSIFNATGQPAISLPLHWTSQGLPIGIQFAAACGREDLLLGLAAALERDVRWDKSYQTLWKKLSDAAD